jgi:hypothetical protein
MKGSRMTALWGGDESITIVPLSLHRKMGSTQPPYHSAVILPNVKNGDTPPPI